MTSWIVGHNNFLMLENQEDTNIKNNGISKKCYGGDLNCGMSHLSKTNKKAATKSLKRSDREVYKESYKRIKKLYPNLRKNRSHFKLPSFKKMSSRYIQRNPPKFVFKASAKLISIVHALKGLPVPPKQKGIPVKRRTKVKYRIAGKTIKLGKDQFIAQRTQRNSRGGISSSVQVYWAKSKRSMFGRSKKKWTKLRFASVHQFLIDDIRQTAFEKILTKQFQTEFDREFGHL